jgi:hypothetical protein
VKVGFTGTQTGTTDAQRRSFIAWAKAAGATEFHHGCCIGADEDAFDVMTAAPDLGFARPRTVAHPPTNRSKVCEVAEMMSDERREPAEYLIRNRNIVDACDVLTACPAGPEELRSGTWAAVRYARKLHKPLVIVWPDGSMTSENMGQEGPPP